MDLIWDKSDCTVEFHGLTIVASPQPFSPFPVDAIVEEQDTFLLLGQNNLLRETDKPAWYLANFLEKEKPRKLGEIVIKGNLPIRLKAVVHDIEQEPTCSSAVVERTYRAIMQISEEKNITSLAIPPLGSIYGKLSVNESIRLLVASLSEIKPQGLERIWLIITKDSNCQCLSQLQQPEI